MERWVAKSKLLIRFHPFERGRTLFELLLRKGAEGREQFVASYAAANLRPVSDDRPFFHQQFTLGSVVRDLLGLRWHRRSGQWVVVMALLQAIVLATLFILFPLWKNRVGAGPAARKGWAFAYFSLLGLGFILVELIFILSNILLANVL